MNNDLKKEEVEEVIARLSKQIQELKRTYEGIREIRAAICLLCAELGVENEK